MSDAYEYAVSLFYSHGLEESRAALEQIVTAAPDFAPAITSLGVLYVQIGRLDGAQALYESALGRGTTSTDIYNNLGG